MSRKSLKRRGQDGWRAIITGQQQSGESVSEYCRNQKINTKSFYSWRKRLGFHSDLKPEEFIRVRTAETERTKFLCIQTPGGYRIEVPEGSDGAQVKTILTMLAAL